MAEKPPIVRVYGHADSFDIEFVHVEGDVWTCQVPPDTADGVYAVEFWAVNEEGVTAYWTGELFMTNGVCHLEVRRPDHFIMFHAPALAIGVSSLRYSIAFKKRCPHGYDY